MITGRIEDLQKDGVSCYNDKGEEFKEKKWKFGSSRKRVKFYVEYR